MDEILKFSKFGVLKIPPHFKFSGGILGFF